MDDSKQFCQNCKRDVSSTNFRLHSAHCERNITLCLLCEEPIPRSEFQKHMDDEHSFVSCSACDDSIEICKMELHKANCLKRMDTCPYCDLQLPFCNLSEHIDECGSRTEKCLTCRKYVMVKEKSQHLNSCIVEDVYNTSRPCKYCNVSYPLQNLDKHYEICSTKTEKCSTCGEKIQLRDFLNHSKSCAEGFVPYFRNCSFCGMEVPYTDMLQHEEECVLTMASVNVNQILAPSIDSTGDLASIDNSFSKLSKCSYCGLKVSSKEITKHEKICLSVIGQSTLTNNSENGSRLPKIKDSSDRTQSNDVNKSADFSLTCPYCEIQLPSGVLYNHLNSCFKKSSTTQFDEYAGARPKKSDRTSNETEEKYQSRQKKYNMSHFPPLPQDTAYCENVEKHILCPFCIQEFPASIYRRHVHHCSQPMTLCQFCKTEFLSSDEAEHLKICNGLQSGEDFNHAVFLQEKDDSLTQPLQHDFSYNEKLEEEYTACPFCTRKIPYDRYIKHLDVCSQQKTSCKFCQIIFFVADEKEHLKICKVLNSEEDFKSASRKNKKKLKKEKSNLTSSDCDDTISNSNATYHSESLNSQKTDKHCTSKNHKSKDHVCNSSGKDAEKKEKDALEYQKDRPSRIRSFIESFTSREKIQPKASHSGKVLLPCEFCDELISEFELIEHESGCRPDLVSLPKLETETDKPTIKSSNLSAEEEINKAPESIDNHYQFSRYNKTYTTKPGEFLHYYAAQNPGSDFVKQNYHSSDSHCKNSSRQMPIGSERKEASMKSDGHSNHYQKLETETDTPSRKRSGLSAKEGINKTPESNDNYCQISRYNENCTTKPGEILSYSASQNAESDFVKQNCHSRDSRCKNSSKQVPIGSEWKEAFMKEDFNSSSNIEVASYLDSDEKRMFSYDSRRNKSNNNNENSLVSGILSINQYSSASEVLDIYQPCDEETNCKFDVNAITESLNNLHFTQSKEEVEQKDSSDYLYFHYSNSRCVNQSQYNHDGISSRSVNEVMVVTKKLINCENASHETDNVPKFSIKK